MLNLKAKLQPSKTNTSKETQISIRDKLLVREVQEMEQYLPPSCSSNFEDANKLCQFSLTICPDEGFWQGGKFKFLVDVPEDYNIVPPKVKCCTRIWHPNISEDGEVCLSLLRQNSLDGLGWAPTRKLKDIVWGLNSLFSDLLNFDDPLNVKAAEHYSRNQEDFKAKVLDYIQRFAR